MNDYWYTTATGRKVHVLEGETPEQAYKRTYHEDMNTGEPYTMEEEDEIDRAGGLDFNDNYDDEVVYNNLPLNTLTDEDKELLKNKILDLHNNDVNYFNEVLIGGDYARIVKEIKSQLSDSEDIQMIKNSEIAKYIKEVIESNL